MGRESESAPIRGAANEKTLLPAVGAQPNQPALCEDVRREAKNQHARYWSFQMSKGLPRFQRPLGVNVGSPAPRERPTATRTELDH
jgi:hypothetical protein